MQLGGIEIICPACSSDLVSSPSGTPASTEGSLDGMAQVDVLSCSGCRRTYPVVAGIPDLRLWADPYISIEDDRAKARVLAAECSDLDFEESIHLYYRMTSVVPPFQARRFARSLLSAAPRSDAVLRAHEAGTARADRLLELGCGTAPLIAGAGRRHDRVAGVDIALRWLVLAQKRLADQGVSAPLVCACAEALPFPSGTFDRIVAESTLEHLRDQAAALRECSRVLEDGGDLLVITPNARSIGPDPHTGLPAGSWLPESVTAAYVRMKGGIPPRRRLLTQRRLRGLLEMSGFDRIVVAVPDVAPSQRAAFGRGVRFAIDAYHAVKRMPGGSTLMSTIGPLLQGTARKSGTRTPS